MGANSGGHYSTSRSMKAGFSPVPPAFVECDGRFLRGEASAPEETGGGSMTGVECSLHAYYELGGRRARLHGMPSPFVVGPRLHCEELRL